MYCDPHITVWHKNINALIQQQLHFTSYYNHLFILCQEKIWKSIPNKYSDILFSSDFPLPLDPVQLDDDESETVQLSYTASTEIWWY